MNSLLTTKEAADLLGVAPGTLKDWRSRQSKRSGKRLGPNFVKLSGGKTGGQVRYSLEALRTFVRRQTVRVSA